MSRPNPSNGSTQMIIDELKKKRLQIGKGREDKIREALDNISREEFLKALVEDVDVEDCLFILNEIKEVE